MPKTFRISHRMSTGYGFTNRGGMFDFLSHRGEVRVLESNWGYYPPGQYVVTWPPRFYGPIIIPLRVLSTKCQVCGK
jgi:hypothetical protein